MTTQTIESKDLDPRFKYDVANQPGGENLTLCYACGTCTAGCPVARVDDEFNPRRIIRQILLGLRRQTLGSPAIWRCVQCFACTAKCPQNVRFREVMRALWQMAERDGYVPAGTTARVDELGRVAQKARRDMLAAVVADPARFDALKRKCAELAS